MTTVTPYPLCWPSNFPRSTRREKGLFKTQLSDALRNVRNSVIAFGRDSGKATTEPVISSNVSLGVTSPTDPGVAVWFTWDGLRLCIAVDRYLTVAANLQAIHLILESRRTEMRHGGLHIIRAAFAGFQALPAPAAKSWREILGLTDKATLDDAEQAYRERAKTAHPDQGGSHAAMSELTTAIAAARKEFGNA
jgi:hypothetical protein